MWSKLVKNDPAAEQISINKLVGPDGYYGSRTWNVALGHSGMFGAQVDDNKMETILQMLNEIQDDLELYRTAKFGQEGIHHTFNADSGAVWTADYQCVEAQASIGSIKFMMHIFMDEKHLSTYSVIDREYIDYALTVEGVAVRSQPQSLIHISISRRISGRPPRSSGRMRSRIESTLTPNGMRLSLPSTGLAFKRYWITRMSFIPHR